MDKEAQETIWGEESQIDGGDPVTFIPFLFVSKSAEEMRANVFKGGDLPEVGNTLELVCYEISDASGQFQIAAKWQVKR